VAVGLGGLGAQVLYAGQAPSLVSGDAHINFSTPAEAPTGAVPVALVVGGISGPSGVTISIK
jgi:uncharacterized protein (TIGR03437 family)